MHSAYHSQIERPDRSPTSLASSSPLAFTYTVSPLPPLSSPRRPLCAGREWEAARAHDADSPSPIPASTPHIRHRTQAVVVPTIPAPPRAPSTAGGDPQFRMRRFSCPLVLHAGRCRRVESAIMLCACVLGLIGRMSHVWLRIQCEGSTTMDYLHYACIYIIYQWRTYTLYF